MATIKRFGIGGSDACLIYGETSFGRTELDLFMSCRNGGVELESTEHDAAASFRMTLGNQLEPSLVKRINELMTADLGAGGHQVKTYRGPGLFEKPLQHASPALSFMFGRPDCFATADTARRVMVGEAKIVTVRGRAEVVASAKVPKNYYYQALHNAAVLRSSLIGYSASAIFGFYDLVDFEERFIKLDFTEEELEAHESKCAEWWAKRVVNGVPPVLSGDNAGKSAAVLRPGKLEAREATETEAAIMEKVWRLKELQGRVSASIEEEEAKLRSMILEAGAERVWSDSHSYTYSLRQGRQSFDKARFERDHPGEVDKYMKSGEPYRAGLLTARKKKED